jgi:hypothetical protein
VSTQFAIKAVGTTAQYVVVAATLNGASVVGIESITPTSVSVRRMNAGGSTYTDPWGQVWEADGNFNGGQSYSVTNTIRQTVATGLYQSGRTGQSFRYTLEAPNGLYTVVLKFAEPAATGPGQRIFDVYINGATALADFDIFAAAGGANVAVDRSFPVAVSNGAIDIYLSATGSSAALLNAIEILGGTTSASTSPANTIRVNAGGPSFTDVYGLPWAADSGGSVASTTAAIANTAMPAIYQTARSGAATYRFTVPNGEYSVILKFAEIGVGAAGLRQFNVDLNGARVLTNFDIFGAAGRAMTAIDRAFDVTVTNGSLTIALSAGGIGAPLLNGIEIILQYP